MHHFRNFKTKNYTSLEILSNHCEEL